MPAETAQKFSDLESQAQLLMSVFTKAGHDAVAPAVIQPADVFLDAIGEDLRARTYVFTDPDGAELCLRPDLTVPTCRLHIARNSAAPQTRAKYCYNGPAFRYQPQGADANHPREFRQAGIERFGDAAREAAEAETIALIVRALETAGLKTWSLHLGDLGLFRSILAAASIPARWQKRLADAFGRRGAFRDELKRLTTPPPATARALPLDLAAALGRGDNFSKESIVNAYLDRLGLEATGTRTVAELTERLADIAADLDAKPLDAAAARLVESYVAVSGPARTAGIRIASLLKGANVGSEAALDVYDRRLALIANAGIDLDRVTFSAEFGRNLAYYTGLVFEITAPGLDAESPVAGGGRYDGLMRLAGASVDVAAVGGAIHTERLLAVTGGQRS
jgi:ATP phosphoribosyltransferase regulatory subunit